MSLFVVQLLLLRSGAVRYKHMNPLLFPLREQPFDLIFSTVLVQKDLIE
jgi:hypothetical protein